MSYPDRLTLVPIPALVLLSPLVAQCPLGEPDWQFRDPAVVSSFQRRDPHLADFPAVVRCHVDRDNEVVVVLAGVRSGARREMLGVFLRERRQAPRVHELAVVPLGAYNDNVGLVSLNPQELVLSTASGEGIREQNLKFFFDIASKRLIRQVEFRPFAFRYLLRSNGAPSFAGSNQKEFLIVRPVAPTALFRILSDDEARPLLTRIPVRTWSSDSESFRSFDLPALGTKPFGPGGRFALETTASSLSGERLRTIRDLQTGRKFPLPQSSTCDWIRAHPADARAGYLPEGIGEEIGPHQTYEGRLWLGKSFYDAEGESGVGAFGYFDPFRKRYVLYSPPEIKNWSVSAILVEPDSVWLALQRRGEYENQSGGVLRWDRRSQKVVRYDSPSVIHALARYGASLYAGTEDGLAVLRGRGFQPYFIDLTLGGAYAVIPRECGELSPHSR